MRHVAIGGGKGCPELLEKEACIVEELLQPCPRYCAFFGMSIRCSRKPQFMWYRDVNDNNSSCDP